MENLKAVVFGKQTTPYQRALALREFKDMSERLELLEKAVNKNCNLQNVNACTWKEKLEALIDGLEIENKEKLIKDGDVETYKMLGEVMASRIKQLKYWR